MLKRFKKLVYDFKSIFITYLLYFIFIEKEQHMTKKNKKREIKNFEDFQKYSQILTAEKIVTEYFELQASLTRIKENTTCKFAVIEPESYADGWIAYNIIGADDAWKEATFKYFMDLLHGYVKKQGKNNEQ